MTKITSLDLETANYSRVSIFAAGLAVFEDGQLTEAPYWLVRPPKPHGWFHELFIKCRGLTPLDVLEAPEFSAIAPELPARLNGSDLVIAHNAAFDISHLRAILDHFALPIPAKKHTWFLIAQGFDYPKGPPIISDVLKGSPGG